MPPLFAAVAKKIAKDIQGNQDSTLPAIDSLAKSHRVSYQTIRKALRLLEQQGIIELRQGRRSKIVRGTESEPTGKSAKRLFEKLKHAISQGEYRVGEALPKTTWIVAHYRVSSHTVREAYLLLEKYQWIHKSNRKWKVGKARKANNYEMSHIRPRKTVILLLDNFRDWLTGRRGHLNNRFYESLYRELDPRKVDLQIVKISKNDNRVTIDVPSISRIILQLGTDYLGTLIASPEAKNRIREVMDWAPWLCRFGQPVVWYDERDEGDAIGWKAQVGQRKIHRCRPDESGATHSIASLLLKYGHRKIILPTFKEDSMPDTNLWNRRIKDLKMSLSTRTPQVSFATFLDPETTDRLRGDWEMMEDQFFGEKRNPFPKLAAQSIIEKQFRLHRLLESEQPTALIAPTDLHAARYWLSLLSAKVDIPKKISLVSFENDRRLRHFPLATIDHNFEALGYRCAHFFLDDLPKSRVSDVSGKPWFIDKGSLAAAGQQV